MKEIPILKPINFDYHTKFLEESNFKEDFFEEVSTKYPNVILDIFKNSLSEDAKELSLLESQYFKLLNENKFLEFITDIFKENENRCIVKIESNFIEEEILLYNINNLDLIDKYILLKQFKELKDSSSIDFLIEDLNLLKMFMKGIIREVFNLELYFDKKPIIIFSNFDLSIPLVFKNKKDKEYYKLLAKKHNLYFR